jgi:acetyl esterase/lipase
MLDDRTCVNEKISKLPLHINWNNQSNMYAWSLYLGPDHKPGDETLPKYASASRRAELSGLPPALITVGDLDLFHDECTEYVRRLENDGVKTNIVVTVGGFHAYMLMQPDKGPSVEAWNKFHAFGMSFLSGR